MCRAAAQEIPDATVTKVLLDTTLKDIGGMADIPNKRINITSNGGYLLTATFSVNWIQANDDHWQTLIYVDGAIVDVDLSFNRAGWTAIFGCNPRGIRPIDLSAGSYVEGKLEHDEGEAVDTRTEVYSRFTLAAIQVAE
jgi:hypothetical protein